MTEKKNSFETYIPPRSPLGYGISAVFLSAIVTLTIFVPMGLEYLGNDRKAVDAQMVQLADQGKPEALLWAATQHSLTAEKADSQLKQAAEMGNPQAMFAYGRHIEGNGDSGAALPWYEKSAAEGYRPAVEMLYFKNKEENER